MNEASPPNPSSPGSGTPSSPHDAEAEALVRMLDAQLAMKRQSNRAARSSPSARPLARLLALVMLVVFLLGGWYGLNRFQKALLETPDEQPTNLVPMP